MPEVRVANDKGLMALLVAVLVMCGGVAATEVPAVYVFGDSTVDVGNNGPLDPPYGIDFPHPERTGRVSNGYNVADSISRLLGFEMSPPAYNTLTPETSGQILRGIGGVNYASGGSGILDTTMILPGVSIPLSQQVKNFADTRSKMAEYHRSKGSVAIDELNPKSFFLISSGGNDMFAFIWQNRTQPEVPSFYDDLISNYTKHVRDLYILGARRFGIVDVPPLGCVPLIRAAFAGECSDEANTFASLFNIRLRTRMTWLATTQLPGMKFSVGSSYKVVDVFTKNPVAAGFTDVATACCGDGTMTGCVPNATVCDNRDDHLYWDAVHSSQATANRGADLIYAAPVWRGFAWPINFRQLVSSPQGSDRSSSS